MKSTPVGNSRHSWLCYGIFLIGALLICPVQDYVQSRSADPGQEPDILFFSSPAFVKKMALGYDSLLADFYWMRAIQYYGRRDEADKRKIRYKNLPALLDITTTLDPDLMDAYRSGSCFLAEEDPVGAGQPKEALKLLDKGIRMHPQDWRLLHDKGFVYYWYLKDFKGAGETWMQASRIPGSPHWLPNLAATSLSKGGSFEVAIDLWQQQYRNSTRANIRETARNHIISFQAAKEMWELEFLAEQYNKLFQSYPPSLRALVRGQEDKYSLVDPLGTPYQYFPQSGRVSLSPDTKVVFLQVPEIYKESLQKKALQSKY
jgi:tetratricopeptide (TPR) repeat protein